MNNRDVAASFDEIADLLEFQNANPFRVRAYRNAARRITDLPEPLANVAADPNRDLTDIDGIGKDLAQKIEELLETGSIGMLEQLRSEIPGGVLAMVRIPGMGPKKAAALYKELGITSLDALRAACQADQVQALKGFGKKTQEKILAGIDLAASAHERMYWAHADEIVQDLLAHMRQVKGIRQIEVAGSYRRGRETIGDIDLLVDADDAERRDGPAWPVRGNGHRASAAATRKCRSGSAAACKSISASCRRNRSARRCNTSPARRTTTSSSAAWPKIAACGSTNTACSASEPNATKKVSRRLCRGFIDD